jgi:hypothetical protein
VTSQTRDFDADLGFDRFGMTGFFEAVTDKTALRISSSFIGFNEIGLALAISPLYRKLLVLTINYYNSHTYLQEPFPPTCRKEGAAVLITPSLAYRLIKKGTLGSFGVRGGPRYGRRGPLHRPFRLVAIPLTSLHCSAWLDSSRRWRRNPTHA